MLESRWLECKRPAPMLRYLVERASPRKLRLFVCACVRRTWPWLRSEASRQAVEELERLADGRRSRTPTRAVREMARQGAEAARERGGGALAARQEADRRRASVWGSIWVGDPPAPSILIRSAAEALEAGASEQDERIALLAAELIAFIAEEPLNPNQAAEQAASIVALGRVATVVRVRAARWARRADEEADRPVSRARAAVRAAQAARWIELQEEGWPERETNLDDRAAKKERRAQSALIRELFGNPFHAATIEPAWLDWKDGCLVKMARAIYDERKYQDMAILADALDEAGCHTPEILNHCRQPGEHIRGCWVVDLLLGLT